MKGRDVRDFNLHQVNSVAKIIKSMFGPNGFSKIISRGSSEFVVTKKGLEVAKALKTRLPIVQMLIESVESQEENCGDGTKTVLMLTEFLLEKAHHLLAQGISAQVVNQGFSLATDKALEILEENVISLDHDSEKTFRHLFSSIMTNRIVRDVKQYFIDLLLKLMAENQYMLFKSKDFDSSDISFRKCPGKSMTESELVNGVIIYKGKPNSSAPSKIRNPRILLIQKSVDFFAPDNTSTSRELEIDDPAGLLEFSRLSKDYYRELAEFLQKKGVNVILCQKKINEYFNRVCANLGIIALEMVGEQEIRRLSKMLKVRVVSIMKDISENDIGKADLAEFRKISEDEMFFIMQKFSRIFTFLLRGGTPDGIDELEEVLKSSLRVAIQTAKDEKILPGGGALECELSRHLRQYANTFPNKVQMVITEFADALENIPGYIVMNSGGDPLDVIPTLRSTHKLGSLHDGFDCYSNSVVNVIQKGIVDGYHVKKQALIIASEMARQIIRVDDLMIYDGKLHERMEEQRKFAKQTKRNKDILEYFKKNEEKLFTP